MRRLKKFLRGLMAARKLDQILKGQQNIMAAIDDLKGAVGGLGTSISNELAAIAAKLASIPAGGTSDADVATVVTQINTLKDQVDAETATLTGPAPTA
jgi:hypothetical protein